MARKIPAQVGIGADSSALDPDLRKARGKLRRFGSNSARDIKKAWGGVKRQLGTLAGVGLVGTLAASGRSVFNFEKRLTRLGIQANKSNRFMDGFRKDVRKLAVDTGIAADQILDGAAMFVSLTGDMDGATAAAGTFARVAAASGAGMEDIATSAAALSDSLKIDPKDFEQAFSILLHQGKAGAIELKEFAALAAGASAQFQNFGTTGKGGLAQMGAMLQVIRKGFGNSAEAATGFMGLMKQLSSVQVAKQLKKYGIATIEKDAKTGKKQLRDMVDIINDIAANKKLNADPLALGKIFSRAEGKRALDMVLANRDGMLGLWSAGLKSKAVAEDYDKFTQSSSGRMARTWQRLQNTIARVFTPDRIKKFAGAMETVADMVSLIVNNLKAAAAVLVGMKVAPGVLSLVAGGGAFGLGGGGGGKGGKGRGKGKGKGGGVGAGSVLDVLNAGALGYAFGTLADQALGLSDRFAGIRNGQTTGAAQQEDAANKLINENNLKQFDSKDGKLKSLASKYAFHANAGETGLAEATLKQLVAETNKRGYAQAPGSFLSVSAEDFRKRVRGPQQQNMLGDGDPLLNPKGRGQLYTSDSFAIALRDLESRVAAPATTATPTAAPLTPEEIAIAGANSDPFAKAHQQIYLHVSFDDDGRPFVKQKTARQARRGK